ncbi:2,3-bisphosphoglycerate-dependent phosphoglycerate mutase [Micromonospora sp. MH33]|uniref:histidine phosphatase family protein n=1 Tax=Micromonospora sp. MH33 TaxID=1945509 RepID=UPI000D14AB4C|nr:histidine phosphatase family protein [Micromonospora sp. MH33]PSK64840.1 2,3-bisphosphoglycerate-dependent phosphoglycerate mutase [Micromonospora sp. MH33]
MTVTTELLLTRHGEANNNATGTVGGELGCTGLSPLGRSQVQRLAQRLALEHQQRPFDAFYGTPRRRVRESIEIITEALPVAAEIVDDLRGPDHGDADSRPWHEVKTAFGGPPQHNPDQPYATGSETWNQYLDRATRTLRQILERHAGRRILIAAHGETIEAAHVLLLQLPPATRLGLGFLTDYACISRWQKHVNRFDRHVWTLAAHNDTRHLTNRQQ